MMCRQKRIPFAVATLVVVSCVVGHCAMLAPNVNMKDATEDHCFEPSQDVSDDDESCFLRLNSQTTGSRVRSFGSHQASTLGSSEVPSYMHADGSSSPSPPPWQLWTARNGKCEREEMQPEIRSAIQTPPTVLKYSNVGSKASIALLLLGRSANVDDSKRIKTNFIEAVGEDHVDTFLNVGADGGELLAAVQLLRPKVWSLNNFTLPTNFSLCKGEQRKGTCIAEDNNQDTNVGCYKHDDAGRPFCSRCDTLKYYQQFGRIFLTYTYAKEYEALHSLQYMYFVRMRTDLIGWKGTPFFLWSEWSRVFDQSKIYIKRLEAKKLKYTSTIKHGEYFFHDKFFVAPRLQSDKVFSALSTYMHCQRQKEIEHLCVPNHWTWATPECILKVHLKTCLPGSISETFPLER
eukprot:gnl/TRDRNA2_/TRDRNA2_174705_c0_seq8.p1 gnl/TRDRNA2_/TRDRNA2_174705_c0~~gnl/TRDRNA2_/TRDRNA2_174705_c0_seq8.p1  ORF type:complete len:404 (-),score=34.99 gnl/TRDRNA2_/TRDRNA2_174705_c0_seq8:175-1386(-)